MNYSPTKNKSLALKMAKLDSKEKQICLNVIYCSQTENYYIDESSLIRNFETLIATFEKGRKVN